MNMSQETWTITTSVHNGNSTEFYKKTPSLSAIFSPLAAFMLLIIICIGICITKEIEKRKRQRDYREKKIPFLGSSSPGVSADVSCESRRLAGFFSFKEDQSYEVFQGNIEQRDFSALFN